MTAPAVIAILNMTKLQLPHWSIRNWRSVLSATAGSLSATAWETVEALSSFQVHLSGGVGLIPALKCADASKNFLTNESNDWEIKPSVKKRRCSIHLLPKVTGWDIPLLSDFETYKFLLTY